MVDWCFLCKLGREFANHNPFHFMVARWLWVQFFELLGVLPCSMDTLVCYRVSFVQKRHGRIWRTVPFPCFSALKRSKISEF